MLRKYIGAFIVQLGGVDVITFTGGVGENNIDVRRDSLAGLSRLGIEVDPASQRGEEPRRASYLRIHVGRRGAGGPHQTRSWRSPARRRLWWPSCNLGERVRNCCADAPRSPGPRGRSGGVREVVARARARRQASAPVRRPCSVNAGRGWVRVRCASGFRSESNRVPCPTPGFASADFGSPRPVARERDGRLPSESIRRVRRSERRTASSERSTSVRRCSAGKTWELRRGRRWLPSCCRDRRVVWRARMLR